MTYGNYKIKYKIKIVPFLFFWKMKPKERQAAGLEQKKAEPHTLSSAFRNNLTC